MAPILELLDREFKVTMIKGQYIKASNEKVGKV